MGFVDINGVEFTDEDIERVAAMFESGKWPEGETRVIYRRGRPPLLDEELQSVTFKDARSQVAAMDARAESLGMSRSSYLRFLVARDLATA